VIFLNSSIFLNFLHPAVPTQNRLNAEQWFIGVTDCHIEYFLTDRALFMLDSLDAHIFSPPISVQLY
jgi:hypothetical protein